MGRRPILKWQVRRSPPFPTAPEEAVVLYGISRPFGLLSPASGHVIYVLLTRAPLTHRSGFVRLACVKPAASVRSEPGSNSPVESWHSLFRTKRTQRLVAIQFSKTGWSRSLAFSFERRRTLSAVSLGVNRVFHFFRLTPSLRTCSRRRGRNVLSVPVDVKRSCVDFCPPIRVHPGRLFQFRRVTRSDRLDPSLDTLDRSRSPRRFVGVDHDTVEAHVTVRRLEA